MKKIQLIFLIFSIVIVSANAQKPQTKKEITGKNIVRQKDDAWQEYKYPDFSVEFPGKPTKTKNVFALAKESERYSAVDSGKIEYSIERLEFSKEFWQAFEGLDQKETIYNNLEMQQEALGATLLFRAGIFQQSISGRTSYFKLKEKKGEALDLVQNAFKKGDRVYIVRALMPVKLMRNEPNGLKDFPPRVKIFLASFRFLSDEKELNDFPPPPPPAPKPTGRPKDKM